MEISRVGFFAQIVRPPIHAHRQHPSRLRQSVLYPFVEDAIEYVVPDMERTTPWEQLRDRFEDGMERMEEAAIERVSDRD